MAGPEPSLDGYPLALLVKGNFKQFVLGLDCMLYAIDISLIDMGLCIFQAGSLKVWWYIIYQYILDYFNLF